MILLNITKIQSFFDNNGLDTLRTSSIPVEQVIDGVEYCTEDSAYKELGYFQSLYNSLKDYAKK